MKNGDKVLITGLAGIKGHNLIGKIGIYQRSNGKDHDVSVDGGLYWFTTENIQPYDPVENFNKLLNKYYGEEV